MIEEFRIIQEKSAKEEASKVENKQNLKKMASVVQAVKKAQTDMVNNDNKPVFVKGVNMTLLKSLSAAQSAESKAKPNEDKKPAVKKELYPTPPASPPHVTGKSKAIGKCSLQNVDPTSAVCTGRLLKYML